MYIKRGFILLLSILLLLVLYLPKKNKDEDIGQFHYKEQVVANKKRPKKEYSYRRNVYPDKISLHKIERKVALKLKETSALANFKGKKILALGDSLIEGFGPKYSRGGFISALDRTINKREKVATFKNYGKLGERTTDLSRRLKNSDLLYELEKTDILIIAIGSNDLLQIVRDHFTELTLDHFQQEQIHFEERLRDILHRVEGANPKIDSYMIGLYNPLKEVFGEIDELDEIITSWNESIKNISESFQKTSFIPIEDLFEGATKFLAEDQFHPNERGYTKIAERVLDHLLKEGE